jgi:hypothetical protein
MGFHLLAPLIRNGIEEQVAANYEGFYNRLQGESMPQDSRNQDWNQSTHGAVNQDPKRKLENMAVLENPDQGERAGGKNRSHTCSEHVQNQEGNKRSWGLLQTEESQQENKPKSCGVEKGYEEKRLTEQNWLEQKRLEEEVVVKANKVRTTRNQEPSENWTSTSDLKAGHTSYKN